MKLAVLSPDDGGGGIATFYSEFSGFCSDSLTCNIISANPFQPSQTRRLVWRTLPLELQSMLRTAEASYASAASKGVAIIEVCDWPLNFVPAVLRQELPYVVQCHGSMGQIAEHDSQERSQLLEALVQLIEPQLLRTAHLVQTYSRANQKFWEQKTGRDVTLIRPPFKTLPIQGQVTISDYGRAFGRLQRWKGPHVLCEALRLLGSKAVHVEWYGGVKPWGRDTEPANKRLSLDFPTVWESIFFHKPALPRRDVAALQQTALFNVVPSTWDVFNFTAVEAMAAARPTIVSTGAGASELVVDGENGFVFENGNSEALAMVIDRVLSMPERRRSEIGRAGRATIEMELEPRAIMRSRTEAYYAAVDKFEKSPPPKPDDWLVHLLSPRSDGIENFDALLDPVPLKAMGEHFVRRVIDKVRKIKRV